MRPLIAPTALLLVLAACSQGEPATLDPLAEGAVHPALPLEFSGAKETIIDFLDAYATAQDDRGERLRGLVATRRLAHWVRWLNVQNDSLEGPLTGTVDLRSLRVMGTTTIQGTPALQVQLSATVSFHYEPPEGDPVDVAHAFDGPATLVQRGPGDWLVADIVRDGQSMLRSIQISGVTQRAQGFKVAVASVFTFQPSWMMNVVVTNRTGEPVLLDPVGTILRVASEDVPLAAATPSLRNPVPDRGRVQASLLFAADRISVVPDLLQVSFTTETGGAITLVFPFAGPGPTSTPSPSPPGEVTPAPTAGA